jgi:hypothetical protein
MEQRQLNPVHFSKIAMTKTQSGSINERPASEAGAPDLPSNFAC